MKISVIALGSQGDVQPFIALAIGLKAAGHSVCVATGTDFEKNIRALGLDFMSVGGDLRAALSSPEGKRMFKSKNPFTFIHRMRQAASGVIKTMQEDILAAMGPSDATVYSYLAGPVVSIHEKTGIPCILGLPVPLLRTGDFAHCSMTTCNLGSFLNRRTYDIVQLLMYMAFGSIGNRWRRDRLGLAAQPVFHVLEKLQIPVLCAFSRHVIPHASDWSKLVSITGYWIIDSSTTWQAPAELEQFIQAGPPPVCIGFGSMDTDDANKISTIVKETLLRLKLRGILIGGWGNIMNHVQEKSDTFFYTDQVPYDWLLPKTSAIVHHGGAGTTGAGLRAGIPSVIIPFCAEQPFWAQRVYALGAGPKPIALRTLTVEKLTNALHQALTDDMIRTRAKRIGEAIRTENGVAAAVEFIHTYLGFERHSSNK